MNKPEYLFTFHYRGGTDTQYISVIATDLKLAQQQITELMGDSKWVDDYTYYLANVRPHEALSSNNGLGVQDRTDAKPTPAPERSDSK